ncbi:hypothetical protein SCLCIDRAFT_762462 [Scleroderma citrinum Foug A]|uniref:Uncharacterized protein n=1 Tax=Scleroderma citrinum Foug A TaxID=1036808 RepID=A0A0C3E451_9AGAM|nr:hypothetical protein SCLCIDRAFT_762462 [Scleroderma citrinum Foug A]
MQLVSISLALVAHGAPILIVGNQPKSPRNRIKLLFTDYRIYRQTQEENHDVHAAQFVVLKVQKSKSPKERSGNAV